MKLSAASCGKAPSPCTFSSGATIPETVPQILLYVIAPNVPADCEPATETPVILECGIDSAETAEEPVPAAPALLAAPQKAHRKAASEAPHATALSSWKRPSFEISIARIPERLAMRSIPLIGRRVYKNLPLAGTGDHRPGPTVPTYTLFSPVRFAPAGEPRYNRGSHRTCSNRPAYRERKYGFSNSLAFCVW